MSDRLIAVLGWLAIVVLVGCGGPGYQTPSGGPGGIGGAGGAGGPASQAMQAGTQSGGQHTSDTTGAGIGPHSILVGDMNLNGVPDVADSLVLRRIAAGLQEAPPNRYPDITGDGKVDEEDCRLLERAVAGLEPWPIRSIGSAIVLDLAPDLEGIRDGYSPEPVEVAPGDRFTVDVWALEVAEFDSFRLHFDLGDRPGIRIDDVREGPFLASAGAEVQFNPVVDGDGATVVGTVRNVSGGSLPSGEGVIAQIDLRALSPGSETAISVGAVEQDADGASDGPELVMHGALVRVASQ